MRTTFMRLLFVLAVLVSLNAQAREISLFDSTGEAVAYIELIVI